MHSDLQVWLFLQPSPLPPPLTSPSAQDHPQKPGTGQLCRPPRPAANWLPLCPGLLPAAGAAGTVTAVPAAPGWEAPRRTAPCPHPPAPGAPRSPRWRCLRTRGTAVWELSRGASSPLKQRGGGERGGQRERERVSEREGAEAGGEERRERAREETGGRGTQGDRAGLPGLKGRREGRGSGEGTEGRDCSRGRTARGVGRRGSRVTGRAAGRQRAGGWAGRGGQGAPPVLCPLWHLGGWAKATKGNGRGRRAARRGLRGWAGGRAGWEHGGPGTKAGEEQRCPNGGISPC